MDYYAIFVISSELVDSDEKCVLKICIFPMFAS